MKFREAIQTDLEYMADHTVSRGCFKDQPEMTDYVYALEHGGKLLAVGGIKVVTPTVAWAWVDLSDNAKGEIRTVYRTMKEWLDTMMKDHGIKRLMAAVECDFEDAIRTAEHMGFSKESLMLKWKNNKPAYMYVRLEGA